MRCSAMLMSATLFLAPVTTVLAQGPVTVDVAYLGKGIFQFKDAAYGYNALVAAVQAAYSGEQIGVMVVDMGTVASQLDKATVCQLRQSLLTRVKMQLTVEGEKRDIFCN